MSLSTLEATTPLLGISPNIKDTSPRVAPGVQVLGVNGKLLMYVQAPAAIGANGSCTIDTTTISFAASSVAGGTITWTNGSVAFVAAEYGWVFKDLIRISSLST